MALVRNRGGQFCKVLRVLENRTATERVSKMRQKPAAGFETTEVNDELDSGLQDY